MQTEVGVSQEARCVVSACIGDNCFLGGNVLAGQPGIRANLQADQPADKRSGVLDYRAPACGTIDCVSNFLAPRRISQSRFRRSGEGPQRDHRRIAGKNLAFNRSERRLAAIGRRSDCRDRSAPGNCGRKILGTVYGGNLRARNDSAGTRSFRSRSLVYAGRGNMPGNSGRKTNWPRWERSCDCSRRTADAPHGNRKRAAARPRAYSP